MELRTSVKSAVGKRCTQENIDGDAFAESTEPCSGKPDEPALPTELCQRVHFAYAHTAKLKHYCIFDVFRKIK